MLYRHSESQAWRSEDEEPIEVLGDQVIWPQGAKLWRVHRGCSAVKKLGLIGETMEKPGFYRGNPITNHEKNETNIGFYREFQLLNMF